MCFWRKSIHLHYNEKQNFPHEPPIPDSVCQEEMQNATPDNDVIIEYIMDAQGRKVKKLKSLLIKSEPDREDTHHIHSDDNLPKIPEDNLHRKEK